MDHPIVRTFAWMATVAAWCVLGGWIVARLLSDRLEWSQYLFWVPSPGVLMLSAVVLLAGTGLARKARGLGTADALGARPPAARMRKLAWGMWVGVLIWVVVGEYHMHRYVFPVPTPRGAVPVRVMYWNPSYTEHLPEHVAAVGPDILVMANAPGRSNWTAVREAVGAETSTVRYERFTLVSRFKVLRWAGRGLGIQGARPRAFIWRGGGNVVQDEGQAVFVELDTREVLGRTTVVWALDLPSDFNLSRWMVMRQSAAALAEPDAQAFERTAEGLDQAVSLEHGFPTADVIVGDFNTPRSSKSLTEVSGMLTHAFDQAGRGMAATWPREWPVFAIDQAFVGADLRATKYQVVDFNEGHHRALVFEVVGREP